MQVTTFNEKTIANILKANGIPVIKMTPESYSNQTDAEVQVTAEISVQVGSDYLGLSVKVEGGYQVQYFDDTDELVKSLKAAL